MIQLFSTYRQHREAEVDNGFHYWSSGRRVPIIVLHWNSDHGKDESVLKKKTNLIFLDESNKSWSFNLNWLPCAVVKGNDEMKEIRFAQVAGRLLLKMGPTYTQSNSREKKKKFNCHKVLATTLTCGGEKKNSTKGPGSQSAQQGHFFRKKRQTFPNNSCPILFLEKGFWSKNSRFKFHRNVFLTPTLHFHRQGQIICLHKKTNFVENGKRGAAILKQHDYCTITEKT